METTIARLAAVTQALADLPDGLPDPSSITVYPDMRTEVRWSTDDEATARRIASALPDGHRRSRTPGLLTIATVYTNALVFVVSLIGAQVDLFGGER